MNDGFTNRLIFEKSPYLLQHSTNPVDWYPWSLEAFKRAIKEDKPIFLSIGYSACHWCHVMERESFEDIELAKLLNDSFICIKVDREERPDIDSIYMKVCQLMTGSGGWPLNIIMTPKKKPFFAATYIPKESKLGFIGMMELIPNIIKLWKSRKEELVKSSEKVLSFLKDTEKRSSSKGNYLNESTLKVACNHLSNIFDEQYGGFGEAPKFPVPHNLIFLLHYWKRTNNYKILKMVEKTLEAMQQGGIYDHIGFGFHRYSTDSTWLIPHFEKMLYDQALLTITYTEAYQATGKEGYKQTAMEVIKFVLQNLYDPHRGFYSSIDADSEGEEGKFYQWTEEELRQLLSEEEAELIIDVFNINRNSTQQNILYLKKSFKEIAYDLKISLIEFQRRLDIARQKLLFARSKRIHPMVDDKILTDWNGLMIAALAYATQVYDEIEYVEAAKKAANLIMDKISDCKGRLYHSYRGGEAKIYGFLDDYAFFVWGLIEIYESTFELKYLKTAIQLTEDMIKTFWDDKMGGFYFTSDDENILFRNKELHDNAYPSGNSVAALNLIRLARITGDLKYEERTMQTLQAFSKIISDKPSAYTQTMVALDFTIGPSYEIVISGYPEREDTKSMLHAIWQKYIPNKVVILRPANQEQPEITHIAKYTKYLTSKEGKATAYICRNYQCNIPTIEIQEMLLQLNEG